MEELNAWISFDWKGNNYPLSSIYSRFLKKPVEGEDYNSDLYQMAYDACLFYKLNDAGPKKTYHIRNVVLGYLQKESEIWEMTPIAYAETLELRI